MYELPVTSMNPNDFAFDINSENDGGGGGNGGGGGGGGGGGDWVDGGGAHTLSFKFDIFIQGTS